MAKLMWTSGTPPSGMNAYAGFFVIMGWVSIGNQDSCFAWRGVHAARKGQGTMKEIGLPQTEKLVNDIIGEGARVMRRRRRFRPGTWGRSAH